MSIEKSIAEVFESKLNDGTIEKVIENEISKCVAKSIESLFGYNGEAKKVIDEKLSSTIVPMIESHDFNNYLVKLDTVLTDLVNEISLKDNRIILDNFKELMTEDVADIKISDMFEKWCRFVADNVDTSGLDVEFGDGPYYESVDVELEVKEIENRMRSSFERYMVYFTCEQDENMNIQFEISRWSGIKDEEYTISDFSDYTIRSIRYLDDMQIFINKLCRNKTKIIIDIENANDYITPEKEPEASYN